LGKPHKYDGPDKQEAREKVHSILAQVASPTESLIILAGTKRHEVDTAVNVSNKINNGNGWSIENIIPVDCDPWYMANFVRQFEGDEKAIIQNNRRIGLVSEVCKDIVQQGGHVAAIHLDFEPPIEGFTRMNGPRAEIEKVLKSGVIMPGGMLAITVLNGRVKGYTLEDRLNIMDNAVRRGMRNSKSFQKVTWGKYQNHADTSCSPMLWSIYQIGGTKNGNR